MNAKLSQNEMEMLGRQAAALSYQLSEIAGSLESRLGETNELAASARNAERAFAQFAQQVRRHMTATGAGTETRSQTA
jgi:hypothetical protein